jgi:TolB protein
MGRPRIFRRRRAAGRRRRFAAAGLALAAVAAGAPLEGQEGGALRLGLTYEARYVPGMVVAPVSASAGFEELGAAAGEILRTDLDYSDRFDILAVPDTLRLSDPPNYALWNQLGAVWLVTSNISVAPGTQTPLLRVSLHDVVYGNLENVQAFSLPPIDAADFRMSVHRISDRIVSWATGGQRGIAATRIALRRRDGDGSSHLLLIDSDGRNPQRIEPGGRNVFSPAFSPDATRIAYTIQDETGYFSLVEMNLITGSRRTVASGRLIQTPTWTPDGRLAYAEGIGGTARIAVEGGGQLTDGRVQSLNPSFSPDGALFAYEADPANEQQIYVRGISGGPARRISIYHPREDTNAAGPDWSPNGDRIAYSALSDRRWQIFTVNPDGTDRRMLTRRGESEDPSWAPDGRHLVFSSVDAQGSTVWILDVFTGRSRPLTAGRLDGLPDWSPPIPPGS